MEEIVLKNTQMTEFINEFCVGKDTETEQIIAGMTAVIEGNEFALEKMKNQKWFERIWFTITGKNKATVVEMTQKRDVLAKFTIQLFIKMLDMLSNNARVIADLYRAVSILSLTVDRTVTDLNNLAVKLNEKIISVDNYNNIITDIQNGKFDKNQPLLSLIDILSLVDERTARDLAKLTRIKETMVKNGFLFNARTRADELAEQVFSLPEEKVGRIYLFCQKLSDRSCFFVYICRLIENYFYVSRTDRRIARQNGSAVNKALDCSGLESDSECFLNDIFDDVKNNLFDESRDKSLDNIVKISEEKSINTEKPIENIKKSGTGMIGKKDEKPLMIVKSDGREAQYAQLLFQLIGKLSNFEASQPMTEAEYKANSLTIDNIPNEKLIFFGNGKEAIIQGKAVNWQYDSFGMRYGWLGKRCVVTADPNKISLKEQNAFAEYYNSRISEFSQILKLQRIHYSETETLDFSEINDEMKWKDTDDTYDKVTKTVAAAILGIPSMLVKGAADTVENIRATIERDSDELWKHQYELLVCEYILNGFTRFMNDNIEKDAEKKAIIVYDSKDTEYAHLLHNLIQQYSGYDVAEYTEKMFIDNAKNLSSKNKIIFLGKTKSSKERWLDINRYIYYKNGMRYGWSGNHAFIYARPMKSSEIEAFKEEYSQKSEEFKDRAKTYAENNDCNIGKNVAKGFNVAEVAAGAAAIFSLPGLLLTYAARAGINYGIGAAVDKGINKANTVAELSGYQYQLLLREFVFNDFEKFMEEA